MPGMITRNTMIAPCSVKSWLYVSAVTSWGPGNKSSVRTSRAKKPPSRNAVRMAEQVHHADALVIEGNEPTPEAFGDF